jgi:hypothetical protein
MEGLSMELKMENLEVCFTGAKFNKVNYVGVLIEMEGFPQPEVIINKAENIDSKLAYYKKTYDENLNHRFAPSIRIVGCSYGNSFAELESDLITG